MIWLYKKINFVYLKSTLYIINNSYSIYLENIIIFEVHIIIYTLITDYKTQRSIAWTTNV